MRHFSLMSLGLEGPAMRARLKNLGVYILHGSNRGAASPGASLGQGLLVEVGALGAAGQVGLHLPELGQVEGGDLLRLLDLLLV